MKPPGRRDVLLASIFASGLPAPAFLPCCAEAAAAASLRKAAAASGILFGSSVGYGSLIKDPAYAALLARECAVIVPGNELKWVRVQPAPAQFDFTKADHIIAFAAAVPAQVRGHTLVWHESLPGWVTEVTGRQLVEAMLSTHIAQVYGRYHGRIHSWDVVNEAIDPSSGRADGLRDTYWLHELGPDYIDIAFRSAARADPLARLTYNDDSLSFDDSETRLHRRAVLRLLERLRRNGTPIHALGMQSHLRVDRGTNPQEMMQFLNDVAALGLEVFVTELDVYDGGCGPSAAQKDAMVAETARAYLDTVLQHPAVKLVVTWDLADKYCWLSLRSGSDPACRVRALPYDEQLERKTMWFAMEGVFADAPRRAPSALQHRIFVDPVGPGVFGPRSNANATSFDRAIFVKKLYRFRGLMPAT